MKFEKLNTKVVAAIGVAIILILTIVFIIFNTDLIVNHNKNNSNTNSNDTSVETVSDEAKNRTKDVNELNSVEKKYLIEQNFLAYLEDLDPTILEQLKKECIEQDACPMDIADLLGYVTDKDNPENSTKISGCSGNISYVYENNEFKVDLSGVTCSSGTGNNNPGGVHGSYDDPEDTNPGVYDGTGKVPEDLENREKAIKQLTSDEKNYIVSKNMASDIAGANAETLGGLKSACINSENCEFDAQNYNLYSDDPEIGYFISGCTGTVNVVYVPGVKTVSKTTPGALEVVKDTNTLKANQIRLSDALPHLSATPLQTGDYVKKTTVKAYTSATSTTKGALKVVADTKTPTASEIRLSNVKYRVYSTDVNVGDYVVVSEIDAYVATTKDDEEALKVVADFRTPEKGEIKLSTARPYIDLEPIKVGDYVTEGMFVTDTTKVICK